MERLKHMKESLIGCVQSQISGNLAEVDAEELGEAIDMIKDLEEAIYYGTITKSMEEGSKYNEHGQTAYYPVYMRDIDRPYGRMYYDGGNRMSYDNGGNPSGGNGGSSSSSGGNGGNSGTAYFGGMRGNQDYMDRGMGYYEPHYEHPMELLRDSREGRSPLSRKNYMESKEKSSDKTTHMKELEKYMQELTQDITEMIEKATPEEKQLLQQKVSVLATKIK